MELFGHIKHTNYYTNCNDAHSPIEAVQPFEKTELPTSVGPLVPIYEVEDHGRKKLVPVRLYPTGTIKSIALQDATEISTSIGPFRVELVTFYENGALARAFPLNGKLSGYWSEANEYKLAKILTIPTPLGEISVRPLYVHFYENGALKSVTFWPGETVEVKTPIGMLTIKKGISFHRNGTLASCEPQKPVRIDTPLGPIEAFDPNPNGMSGEKNSLAFTDTCDIAGLSTVTTQVLGNNGQNQPVSFSPMVQRSRCSDTLFQVEPLKIKFQSDKVVFRNGLRPKKSMPIHAQFQLAPFETDKPIGGGSCSA